MTMQEVLNRVNDIIDNHNHHELNLLRNDLEDDIIWENKTKKGNDRIEPPMSIH